MLRNEQIYEAIFDEDAFLNLPSLFAESSNARSSIINWTHSDGEVENFAYSYFSSDFISRYKSSYISKDLWVDAALRPARQNQVFNASQTVTPKRWEQSEIYNELIRPYGDDTFHCIGGAFVTDWGIGILGVNRGKEAGGFDDDAVGALQGNAAVLRHVLMVRGEIAAHRRQADTARSMLDIIGAPAIAVRSDQHIVHANQAAETALRQGLGFYLKNGYLSARADDDAAKLAAAISAATAPFQPKAAHLVIQRKRPEGGGVLLSYMTTVTTLPNQAGPARALILFRDPDAKDPSLIERVKSFYRLTGAEAALAVALSEGLSLAQIAAIRSVRESTIRSQTKALAAKMQCSRQTQIAVLVAKIPLIHPHRGDAFTFDPPTLP